MVLHKKSLTYLILKYTAILISVVLLLPLGMLVFSALRTGSEAWGQVLLYLSFLWNTLKLALPTAFIATFLGFLNAWLIFRYEFPWRKVFAVLLLTPLTIPLFINSMIWIEILDVGGVVYRVVKDLAGFEEVPVFFKNIRSFPLAIFVYSILAYPYAYLIGLNYFTQRNPQVFFSAMSLGSSKIRYFFSIELFLILPYIFLSVLIIFLETLADYGAAEIFALPVISVGLFNLWTLYMRPDSAILLALLTLILIALCIAIYAFFFNKQKFKHLHEPVRVQRINPSRFGSFLIMSEQCVLIFFSTIMPLLFLIFYAGKYSGRHDLEIIWNSLLNSFLLIFFGAVSLLILSLILALALTYCFSKQADRSGYLIYLISYGIPGVMVAIGAMLIFIPLDHLLSFVSLKVFDWELKSVFLSSGFVLLIAILSRFAGMSISNLYLALKKIPDSIQNLAFSFDNFFKGSGRCLIPLLSSSILINFILLTLEIMREIPITMLLRPFNFETLAIYAFSFAGEEDIELSALPSLILVLFDFFILFLIIRLKKFKL